MCVNEIGFSHANQNKKNLITNLLNPFIPGLPDQIKQVWNILILGLSSKLKIQLEANFQ